MHARVTTISGSPDQAEQGIASFRDNTLPAIKAAGGRGGVLLIDRESGNAMAITLWEDEAAMRASEERANELRRTASEELGARRSRSRALRGGRLRDVLAFGPVHRGGARRRSRSRRSCGSRSASSRRAEVAQRVRRKWC